MRQYTAYFVVLMICLFPGAALAQGNKAAAEQLFREGQALFKQGKKEEACVKFAASQKLDRVAGTALNLARCYEETGKLASAWASYIEAADLDAGSAGDPKRRAVAKQRAAALEARVPRLRIEVGENLLALPALVITRDGEPVPPEVLNTAISVDPGPHEVVVQASGHKPFTGSATAEEGKEVVIEVVLEPLPESQADKDPGQTVTTPVDSGAATPAAGSSRKLIAYGVGGAGVAALAVGLGFGLSARSAWNDALDAGCDENNPNDDGSLPCQTAAGDELAGTARSRAMIANIGVGVGVAAIAAGVVLYLTAPSTEERTAKVAPHVSPGEVGVVFSGNF